MKNQAPLVISPKQNQELSAGNFATFTIPIPSNSSEWKFDGSGGTRWLEHGPLLINTDSLKVLKENGQELLQFETLVMFGGSTSIPPLKILNAENEFFTAELSLNTKTILTEKDQQALTVQSPMPYGGYNIVLLSGITISFFVLLYVLFRFWKRKKRTHIFSARKNPKEDALDAIQKIDFLLRETAAEKFKSSIAFPLHTCLKIYCEQNFNISTKTLTDQELLKELQKKISKAEALSRAELLLNTLNEICYGYSSPPLDEAKALVGEARKFIEQTYNSDFYNISMQELQSKNAP